MADLTPTPAPVVNPVSPGPTAPEPTPSPTPVVKPEDAIPYARFKEVNEQLKALREEKEARERAEKQAKEDKLKKDGEYQKLLETRDAEILRLKKVEDEYSSSQKQIREQALAKITDEKMKEIAADLSTPKLLSFVETINNAQPGPGQPKGKPTNADPKGFAPLPNETAYSYGERMKKEMASRAK